MVRFFKVQLRTSDVDAARDFYATVLGDRSLDIVQLHAQSVARGARPHWLGYLDVGDVDRAAAAFAAGGASALGPKWVNPEGLEAAVMRDPGGAVVALARPSARARARDATATETGPEVVGYVLNTADVARAKASYGELFGWDIGEPVDLGALGVFHPFAWERGGSRVGSMGDIAGRPGIHPHWLFQMRVAALDPAMDAVRAGGGLVVGPLVLPTGERVAVCDDAQGAAFAIRE